MKNFTQSKFLGYCGKCGRDVVADFCDHCQRYVQSFPYDKATSSPYDLNGEKEFPGE